MRILCSGWLVRHALGGLSWHHLQYLLGLRRLGHEVYFLEDHGWSGSCFDPVRGVMSDDPSGGLRFLRGLLEPSGLGESWCFLAADGTAYGMSRERVSEICRSCDLYISLSNINWIPELDQCRRRVLVDTDPVFTQVGSHGWGPPFSWYDVLFTFAENVHQPDCSMPTAGLRWLPTRQPVVTDLWSVDQGPSRGHFTTIMNWAPIEEERHVAPKFGQKGRSFEPFMAFPRRAGQPMELAVNPPADVRRRLLEGGWRLTDPVQVTLTQALHREYLHGSRAEFSVAKHGYVVTQCGWFSERSTSYMACGRPVVVEDAGFSRWLPTGLGVLAFRNADEALACIYDLNSRYDLHCRAAREVVEAHFESGTVLRSLLERATAEPTPSSASAVHADRA